ncbi:glycosyltransferase family 2 protein [Methanobrevibacter sp.]|uniref:glycosyltransferase family 2 protein n=1 Tax=Methanobrevibacter sp. TaxID=66852 RepID=UPI0025CC35CE|nr:glycosyltransferase family 2 protein [Methanobrevibacter sp.]MBQ2832682.1 glycosyltransferase family 2 protein [Methanobrevibacter sp.]
MNENENKLKKCLQTINNQTLKNFETLIVTNNKPPIRNNKINFFNSIENALTNVKSEYILFIDENEYLKNDTCEILYNKSKKDNLDVLYIPILDENMKKSNLHELNEKLQMISPFNFTIFCKKKILEDLNYNNLFYDICRNSKKTDTINQEICFREYLSQNNVENYTNELLNLFPNETDNIFTILFEYLINYPLNLKQNFFDVIKSCFKVGNLNNKNQETYNLINNSDNIIDFFIEYKLNTLNYEIYKNPYAQDNHYKISVIIPIFNNEILLHRTLMSIENQSFGIENIEVVMVNDASTDNTKSVINEYVDKYPNFKAVHIKNRTGSAGTPRNIGLKLASAEYVIFIDHDDFFEINALEKLYNKITKYSCDLVYGTYVLINHEETIKFTYPNEKNGYFKNLEENKRSIITPPSIWTKLFKKDFLIKNNILFPTILGEDAIFMAKSLKNAEGIYYLWNDVICYYNLNESSYSTNVSCDYFVEGFASEKYLYNLFCEYGQIEYYKIRGPGILDFYINRIQYSTLSDEEIEDIFPLFYEFCERLNKLNVKPKLNNNQIAFEYIVKNDLKGFLKFKNYKPNKIKLFSNKILAKINKQGFW